MKKFITYISRQPKGKLNKGIYKAEGNAKLQTDYAVHFPVVTMMHGYVEDGENVELLLIYDRANDCFEDNKNALNDDMDQLKQRKQFDCKVTEIEVSENELARDHLNAFMSLIKHLNDDDELYVCCTFGSKPTPIVQMMAVNFAYKIRRNLAVNCIVYGRVDHHKDPNAFWVYDITSLFFMTQVAGRLADQGIENPEAILSQIMESNDATEEEDA